MTLVSASDANTSPIPPLPYHWTTDTSDSNPVIALGGVSGVGYDTAFTSLKVSRFDGNSVDNFDLLAGIPVGTLLVVSDSFGNSISVTTNDFTQNRGNWFQIPVNTLPTSTIPDAVAVAFSIQYAGQPVTESAVATPTAFSATDQGFGASSQSLSYLPASVDAGSAVEQATTKVVVDSDSNNFTAEIAFVNLGRITADQNWGIDEYPTTRAQIVDSSVISGATESLSLSAGFSDGDSAAGSDSEARNVSQGVTDAFLGLDQAVSTAQMASTDAVGGFEVAGLAQSVLLAFDQGTATSELVQTSRISADVGSLTQNQALAVKFTITDSATGLDYAQTIQHGARGDVRWILSAEVAQPVLLAAGVE